MADTFDVIVAAYAARESARRDFSVVVGGAVGGLVGRFVKQQRDSGIEKGLGDKLEPGVAQ
jgi:hypothetical protein